MSHYSLVCCWSVLNAAIFCSVVNSKHNKMLIKSCLNYELDIARDPYACAVPFRTNYLILNSFFGIFSWKIIYRYGKGFEYITVHALFAHLGAMTEVKAFSQPYAWAVPELQTCL